MPAPLAARWVERRLPELRAGARSTVRVEVENAGTTPWRGDRFTVSYHWLDGRGNAIVWDGLRTPIAAEPGAAAAVDVAIRAPIPPGRYRLSIDLVDEGRFWFGELGSETLDVDLDVVPRIQSLDETEARLGPTRAGAGWGDVVLAAHREGYAVVGGAVAVAGGLLRRRPRALEPYAPGSGRVPGFAHPLVCPSIVRGVEVEWVEVAGLPAALPPRDEPSVYDGRAVVALS